jgi:hypothetical protein
MSPTPARPLRSRPPARLTKKAQAEAARRQRMVGDRTTEMQIKDIADDLHRNYSATRRLYSITREWMDDMDLDLDDPEVQAELWDAALPVPDKWLDPVNQRYPRWWPDTYIRWAVKSDRLSEDLSTPLRKSSGGRGNVPDRVPSQKTLEHRAKRDAVVAEYRRQVETTDRDNEIAFEWVADVTGIPVRIAKRLLLEARSDPASGYGQIPTAPTGAGRRRRLKTINRYNELRKDRRVTPQSARRTVAVEMDLPETAVDRMLRQGLRQPAIYGEIDYPPGVHLLPRSPAIDGPGHQ